jgi:hypothetical protein
MVRRQTLLASLVAAALLCAPALRAQTPMAQPSQMYTKVPQSTSSLSHPFGDQPQEEDPAPSPNCDSAVSYLDSAVPQSEVKLFFDANYDDRRPTRNAYLFSKSGNPGDPGWWTPERRVDWQELTSYVEIAYQNKFSGFMQVPTRWVNPDVNDNAWGLADVNCGFKYAFVETGGLSLTGEIKATIPTRRGPGLSVNHFSFEPGLLFYLRPIEWLCLEGQCLYWVPINGTDFAGQLLDYGLGISFLERSYTDFWFTPVVEVEGWTMLGGKEMVPFPDGLSGVRSTSGETICNAMAGVRLGFGDNGDIYVGGGHSLTGDAWQHLFWRIEFRVRF